MLLLNFTEDGINPTPWKLRETIDELISQNVEEIKFANPLVLEYVRVLIKKGTLKDTEVFLRLDIGGGHLETCKFIGTMWTLPDYENACTDLGKAYPTNEFLNIFENLLIEVF